MPVFNGSKYLRDSIESILNQSYDNFEFIIVDDYSNDESIKIITYNKNLVPKLVGKLLVHLTGLPTYDPTNSYKLYSKKLLNSIELKSKVSFSVTLEIVAKAHCLDFNIQEIPTTWKDRISGKSNFKFFRSLIFYLPWFGISLLRGSFFALSNKKLRKWFFRP